MADQHFNTLPTKWPICQIHVTKNDQSSFSLTFLGSIVMDYWPNTIFLLFLFTVKLRFHVSGHEPALKFEFISRRSVYVALYIILNVNVAP